MGLTAPRHNDPIQRVVDRDPVIRSGGQVNMFGSEVDEIHITNLRPTTSKVAWVAC